MQTNPFYNRKMIKKEEEFVGRIREIDDIINRLRGGNSVSVVGERKIGKSSLLYNLYLRGNKLLDDPEKKKYKFVYIDLQDKATTTPERFVKKVLRKLDIKYDASSLKEEPILEFSELLEINSEKGIKPILLIDEFEAILERKDFDDDFINALRYLANSEHLTYVVASQISLREITDKGKLTSPFWNIFTTLKLDVFSADNNLEETAMFLATYWKNLNISDFEQSFLLWYPFLHPLKLQITCYWLYENRKLQYDDYKLKEEIKNEISNFFRSDAKKLEKFFRREIPKLPDRVEWVTETIGKNLKNLGIKPSDLFK